ncbi:unnamed protein product [Miscanthus lutarioriparius]|uniref:Cytochrome P450 71A1 n=1 Tax=Miscanthus lutarioriparius TaxID=422564 RepID=A0A811RM89_9POAL|nr:unnamed protein product [Miscanthus lutarioriparius]
MAEEVLKNQDHVFCVRPQQRTARGILYDCRDVGFSPYGEWWRQLRRIAVVHLLSAKRVDSLRALRAEEVASLVARVRAASAMEDQSGNRRGINVSELIVSLTYTVISRAVFGNKLGGMDPPSFRAMTKEVADLLETVAVSDMFPGLRWVDWAMGLDASIKRTASKLDDVLERTLEAHEKSLENSGEAGGDLLDDLLSAVKEGGDGFMLDRIDVKGGWRRVYAGQDRCQGTRPGLVCRRNRYSFQGDRVGNGISYQEPKRDGKSSRGGEASCRGRRSLGGAVAEDEQTAGSPQRSHAITSTGAAALLIPRESIQDTKLHGYDIPAKTRVIINAWAIGRDSQSWENAEEFLPERFMHDASDYSCKDYRFIPFGAGRRGCPGNAFAMRLAELALANLLFHFDWELPSWILILLHMLLVQEGDGSKTLLLMNGIIEVLWVHKVSQSHFNGDYNIDKWSEEEPSLLQ